MIEGNKMYRNENKCKACGGKCCMIYVASEEGGVRDSSVWFEEWCDAISELTKDCGVKALFDPLVVHMTSNEHMIAELKEKGIDAGYCNYRGKDGCMIEWNKRPLVCREWKCDKLDENDCIGKFDGDGLNVEERYIVNT